MGAEDIFYKINKRKYNQTLENILDKKDFSEETKNLMLSMLYKIETNYDDYEKVKTIVTSKNEFIERIINIIARLETIELGIKEQNESALLRKLVALRSSFFVDEEYIYSQALIYVMNIGGAIDIEEVIRNFTGWSWDNKNNDILHEYENIIYQSILILVKSKFIDFWRTDITEDCIENLINTLNELYGEELSKEVFTNFMTAALQIAILNNKIIKENFFNKYNTLKTEINKLINRDELVKEINEKRKELFIQLKSLDSLLNDPKLMDEEYEKVKDTVLKKEHFEQKLKIKRIRIIAEMKKCTDMLDPKNYMEQKNELEKKLYPVQDAKLEGITKKDVEKSLNKLQDSVLKAILIDIKKIDNIKTIIKYLYIVRYYSQIPFKNGKILNNEAVFEELDYIQKVMISIAYQNKLITAFSTDTKTNYDITKCLFECGVINIEKIEFLIKEREDGILVEIFDINNKDSEYKLQINKEKFKYIEFNKKKRLFN